MPKVKMGDIKSGSPNVKTLFKRAMLYRTQGWLKKQNYTNNELMEILQISENIERHKDHREFYKDLIISQNGPFNSEVFNAYKSVVFNVDALLNLITNSKGINDTDKAKWIDYTMLTSMFWFMSKFYINGKCNEVGIDIKKSPFNLRLAISLVIYKNRAMSVAASSGLFPLDYEEFMMTVLDSLTKSELYDWYVDTVSTTYRSAAVAFLLKYPNTTADMLENYFEKSNEYKLATHPNFPDELKVEIYKKTGDEQYLPKVATDIFLF